MSESSTETALHGGDSVPIRDAATDVVATNGVVPHPATAHAHPPKRSAMGKALIWVAMAGALVAFVFIRGPERSKHDVQRMTNAAYHFVAGPERTTPPPLSEVPAKKKFDGTITVTKLERETMGMRVALVEAQSKPILLELNGTTDYDQNTMAKVRPLFDARVTEVYKSTGQMVKKGDPLVEYYSTSLAAAKADFRSKYAKWDHDKKFLESRRSLATNGTISNVAWVDTQIAEKTSRVDYVTAKDKLITYGISSEEIDKLLANLGDDVDPTKEAMGDKVHDISRMILRAPIDGMIVERDVVSGNFYDDMAVLMVISPMDKLWVWGNVYEKDQAEVRIGQTWEIQFPYLGLKVEGKVEHIATKVDPNTRTLKIRASIPNPNKQLKAEQLVKAILQIPAIKGQTVIPRNAMAVINGENCCFIESPDSPDRFVRKMIAIDQENHDFVVVKSGINPGEKVVTNGSLILSQLYEDQSTVDTGLPMQ